MKVKFDQLFPISDSESNSTFLTFDELPLDTGLAVADFLGTTLAVAVVLGPACFLEDVFFLVATSISEP